MDIQNELLKTGLKKSEIVVYLYLLENSLSTPPQIAKGTKIARTNCYHILISLKEKGLIEEQAKGKRQAYLAVDPESLVRFLELKKETLERVIPDLRALRAIQKNKPQIKFFEGKEQIKQIYLQSLEAEQIFGLGSTKQLSDLMPDFYTYYTNQIKKKGIVFNDILTSPSRIKGAPEQIAALRALYTAKFLPEKFKDQPTDILIWNNTCAFVTLEEPIFGTTIMSAPLAKSFKTIFDVLWEKL